MTGYEAASEPGGAPAVLGSAPELPPRPAADCPEKPAAGGRLGLWMLLGTLAAWGGWLIYRTSFVLQGRRIFCLFDDAMISMTYARNLVEGYGLNWARRGAPVEGFSHPLWTAMMVPVNLLPIPLDRRPLVVQLVSLGLLLLHVVIVRRLVLRHFTRPGARHWLPAGVLTAFYYPLAFWAVIGMEAALQAVLTTASVLLALDIVYARRNRHLALLLLGTAAVLLRMDMALLVVAIQVYVVANGGLRQGERPGRRGPLRYPAWSLGVLVLVAAAAGYTAFRVWYFGAPLPNTYYLKLAGVPLTVRLLHGAGAMIDTLLAHGPLLLVVSLGVGPLLAAAWSARRGGAGRGAGTGAEGDAGAGDAGDAEGGEAGDAEAGEAARAWGSRLALPALVFVLSCAYSVYIGGDAWESDVRANRFVAFAMPQVFVLFNALLNLALSAARRRLPPARHPLAVRYALAAATAAALLTADGLWHQDDPAEGWRAMAGLTRPLHTEKYAEILGQLRRLQKIADPHAAVAVSWAGITAYFSDFRMIDQLGYNDRHIAHTIPVRALDDDHFDDYLPGHVKWDFAYVLDVQRPDAVLQVWGGKDDIAQLQHRGFRPAGDAWVNPASPRIHLPPPGAAGATDTGPATGTGSEAEPDEPEAGPP
jgi:hypothetical protein